MMFFQRYRTVIVVTLLAILCLVVISISVRHPERTGVFRQIVLECAAPIEGLLGRPIHAAEKAWRRYLFLFGLEAEVGRLSRQNAILTRQLVQYQEGYLESLRLRKLLDLKEHDGYRGTVARVTGHVRSATARTLVIDRGSAHGIKPGQAVIVAEGVVGRVMEASWHAARVLLILDESSNVDAVLQPSRVQGILQGRGGRGCQLKYVGKMAPVRAGDAVVTSGMADVFPKGLLLGVVRGVERTTAMFQKIDVAPAADFSRLEEVLVLTGR